MSTKKKKPYKAPIKKAKIEETPIFKKVEPEIKADIIEESPDVIYVVKVTGFNGNGKMFYSGAEINGKHFPKFVEKWEKTGYIRKK